MPKCMAFRPLQLTKLNIHNRCMQARRTPARLLLLLAIPILVWTGCSLSTNNTSNSPALAQLAASSAKLQFGAIPSTSSKVLSETISNSGGTALTVSQIVADGTAFSFSGINPPVTLSPGQAATFNVRFAPASAGADSGSLSISSNASNPTLAITLSGTSTSPGQLSITPANLNFGNVVVGSSKNQPVSLSASNGPVTIDSANLTGSEFSVSGLSLPLTISSGNSVSYSLIFSPQASGSTSGTLTFSGSASNSGLSQALVGAGVAPTPHTVQLSWTASTTPGVTYNVYRSATSGAGYSLIAGGVTPLMYTDTNVVSGSTYYYVTTAFDGTSESTYSNQASAVIPTP